MVAAQHLDVMLLGCAVESGFHNHPSLIQPLVCRKLKQPFPAADATVCNTFLCSAVSISAAAHRGVLIASAHGCDTFFRSVLFLIIAKHLFRIMNRCMKNHIQIIIAASSNRILLQSKLSSLYSQDQSVLHKRFCRAASADRIPACRCFPAV